MAESAQARVQRALRKSSDPTLKSLLLAARLFDYLGMKSLYALEWAERFRQSDVPRQERRRAVPASGVDPAQGEVR
jgi:hypothetical protein